MRVNLSHSCFVFLESSADCEMEPQKKGEKETKTCSSNRPFDIENLFASDKPTKAQKPSSDCRPTDPCRPNFALMESAALSVNGNYAL